MESERPGPPPLPVVPPPLPLPPPRPWNGWWTLLWAVVVLSFWLGMQTVLSVGYLIASGAFEPAPPGKAQSFAQFEAAVMETLLNGDFVGTITIAGAVVACPLCYVLGALRKGFSGAGYLGLVRPKVLSSVFWFSGFTGLIAAAAVVVPATPENSPEFMVDIVNSTTTPVLLVLGIVVGAPLLEEFVFRGLLFRGWRDSALGLHGAVAVTSIIWTLLHAGQYGAATLLWVFALGLVLGYARHYTGSLWVPIGMHALNNGIATIEMFRITAG